MSSSLLVILLSTAIVAIASCSQLHQYKQSTTHLRFYFHEITSGQNATSQEILPPIKNSESGFGFGEMTVIDDMLRLGPEPTSKLIGRAQGLAVGTALQGSATILTAVNFVFTDGEHNGSTLSIIGRIEIGEKAIERSIVGGTGKFRMARGYTIFKLVSSTLSGLFVFEVDAEVVHH